MTMRRAWTLVLRRTLMTFLSIFLVGCSYQIADFRWTQKESFSVSESDFSACSKKSLDEISGVSVSKFQYDRFIISVPFQEKTPNINVFIQKNSGDTASVVFSGNGWHESSEERSEITPIMNLLISSLKRNCSRGAGTARLN